MIEFDNVRVTVPTADEPRTIINDLSLTLSENRIALIGANGSGKSTIVKMINGLVLPSAGSVSVKLADQKLDTKSDGKEVRQGVGFVFTDPKSQLVMPTVIEDVALSLRRQIKNKHERAAKAMSVLEEYDLAGRAEQSVHTLSGGQGQLLAIASVLATSPQIIVADEPTTLLDLRNSRMIGELLLGLPQQLIVATHDLDFAARCDRVLVIDGGSVSYDGDPHLAIEHYRRTA